MDHSGAPPSGGDQNRGSDLLWVLYSTFTIVLVTVFLRLIGRILILRRFGWDDATMVLATVSLSRSDFDTILTIY